MFEFDEYSALAMLQIKSEFNLNNYFITFESLNPRRLDILVTSLPPK